MQLVLWDIDGTLVDTAGHGRHAFGEAFATVFGRDADLDAIRMGGRTDHWIARAVLDANGIEDADRQLEPMLTALGPALEARRELIATQGRAMPGAHAALQAVARSAEMTQSLLTGNIEPNAALKLAAFDLERLIDLEIGGYGSDHGARSELVEIARSKAGRLRGLRVAVEDVVLIGDTPLDVDAAQTAGARAVGVATGEFDADQLARSGADAVLESLVDPEEVLAAIMG